MTAFTCGHVRDRLPDWVAGRDVPGVAEHLAACLDCRAEAALVRSLQNAAPRLPPGLEARVLNATRARPAVSARSGARQLAIAATLAGAVIGGSLLVRQVGSGRPHQATGGSPAAQQDGLLPVLEDPVVNGGSVLSNLTDAELEALLARMES